MTDTYIDTTATDDKICTDITSPAHQTEIAAFAKTRKDRYWADYRSYCNVLRAIEEVQTARDYAHALTLGKRYGSAWIQTISSTFRVGEKGYFSFRLPFVTRTMLNSHGFAAGIEDTLRQDVDPNFVVTLLWKRTFDIYDWKRIHVFPHGISSKYLEEYGADASIVSPHGLTSILQNVPKKMRHDILKEQEFATSPPYGAPHFLHALVEDARNQA